MRTAVKKSWHRARPRGVVNIGSLGKYYEELLSDYPAVRDYFTSIIRPAALRHIPQDLSNCVAVHIRLGDYPAEMRTGIDWYCRVIGELSGKFPLAEFLVFSDGTDAELAPVLSLPRVKRVFYGNALADMIGISRCAAVVGSDSTFSGFGIFMGQAPAILAKCHFGAMHLEPERLTLSPSGEVPGSFCAQLADRLSGKSPSLRS